MSQSDHERARDLVLLCDVEEVNHGDALWLEVHLSGCIDCSAFADGLQRTARALRQTSVTASASLVMDTQARVRQRAVELRDHEARAFLIGISFCLGLLWSAGSAFVGLKVSGWLGDKLHVAPWIVALGLVVFWLAPAIAMTIGVLAHHPASYHARAGWTAARVKEEWL